MKHQGRLVNGPITLIDEVFSDADALMSRTEHAFWTTYSSEDGRSPVFKTDVWNWTSGYDRNLLAE